MAKSTSGPECEFPLDNGGQTVHPVSTPASAKTEVISNIKDGGNNQKLILFILRKERWISVPEVYRFNSYQT